MNQMQKTQKRKKSRLVEIWRRLLKNKLAVVSLCIIILLVFIVIFGPLIAPYPYSQQDMMASYAKPSAQHLLGTDKLGRDLLSRLIFGARQSLAMGLIAVAIAAVVGIIIGAIAGFYGGWVENVIMRFLDIYQSIPMFLLCVSLAAILGPSLRNAIIAIGISMIPNYARIMRASVLTVREKEFVEASRAINARDRNLIWGHIIPNAMAPVIVEITMGIGTAILNGAALSFMGLGAQPPIPEWGAMISDARSVLREHPYLAMYPGICIMLTVLSFNLLGDGLRDALDPRLKN